MISLLTPSLTISLFPTIGSDKRVLRLMVLCKMPFKSQRANDWLMRRENKKKNSVSHQVGECDR